MTNAATVVPTNATSTTSASATTVPPPGGTVPADLIVRGGVVWAPSSPEADAVAIRDGEIAAVGVESELTQLNGPETRVIDLGGRFLMPGFVDAHAHYFGTGLGEGLTVDEIGEQILGAGVTTVGEMAVDESLLIELQRLDSEALIPVRASAYLLADTACGDPTGDWQFAYPPTREPAERLRIGGIKVFTDGGSCNAPAVSYEHAFGGDGDLYFDSAGIADFVRPYDGAGYQLAIHAIGDRAVEATLDALDTIIGGSTNPLRHRIEHNAVVRPEMRGRYDEVGAVAVIFGSFGTCAYLGRDDRFRFSTPTANQEWEWPWRDLIDQNPDTVFAWHGDYPVFHDSGPIASLSGFVTRAQTLPDGTHCEPEPYHQKHAIDVDEALELMTIGAAYALDRDTEVGSIEVGKMADLVALSADPRSVDPSEIIGLSVDLTIFNGEAVHCADALAAACSDTPQPAGEPTASASLPGHPPGDAIDGDMETHWGSGGDAPQWIEIPLPGPGVVTGVELVVDQHPPGGTVHIVYGRNESGDLVELATVSGETEMFDVIDVAVDESIAMVAVRVETVESPSWVSWREIVVSTAS